MPNVFLKIAQNVNYTVSSFVCLLHRRGSTDGYTVNADLLENV
jgi:hypothetical protein